MRYTVQIRVYKQTTEGQTNLVVKRTELFGEKASPMTAGDLLDAIGKKYKTPTPAASQPADVTTGIEKISEALYHNGVEISGSDEIPTEHVLLYELQLSENLPQKTITKMAASKPTSSKMLSKPTKQMETSDTATSEASTPPLTKMHVWLKPGEKKRS